MKNDIYGVIIPYNFSITEKSNLKNLKTFIKRFALVVINKAIALIAFGILLIKKEGIFI